MASSQRPALTLVILLLRRRGKLLFCAADLGVAALTADALTLCGAAPATAAAGAAVALFNPFTAAVSTRGSCDSLAVLLLLATLRASLRGRAATAGALLGAAAHFRVYPVVHGLPLALFFWGADSTSSPLPGLRSVVRAALPSARFGVAAAASFLALGAACYAAYGHTFLQEAYLYHGGRSDPRHNFSPAFYGAYLRHDSPAHLARAATAQQAAQLAVLVGSGIALRADPPAALFAQTLLFVAFNRVITAQYFTWWMALAPVAAPALAPARRTRCCVAALGWTAAQLHWLAHAASLEFGQPAPGGGGGAFARVWGASLLFFGASVALAAEVMAAYVPRDLRKRAIAQTTKQD
jgi:phosphatidylinositol glycan class M